MMNAFEQPIGDPLPEWTVRQLPQHVTRQGRFCRIEPLDAERHAAELYDAYSQTPDARDWTYLSVGPFSDSASYRSFVEAAAISHDPLHFAVIDLKTGKAVGTFALMRIDPNTGVVEVGWVTFSSALKQTPLSTEAHYLLMSYAFETLGYRRYEWKCDSENAPSRKAAQRLGFQFEGIFRQVIVYKGRNRNTAWFSIIDTEWPAIRKGFESWLAPENFDEHGAQRMRLEALRAAA